MAFLQNQGARIYWDEQGSGDPILLIMGLGYPSYLWHRTRPALKERYRTIALDNRGSGQSEAPAGPYSIAMMASDAAAALDAAGVERAHVFGLSMGGMIAQEFALQYPARVRSLILGCTAPGGPNAVRAEKRVTEILMGIGLGPEEHARAMRPYVYDSSTPLERIEEDLAIRRQWFPKPEAYKAQLQAIFEWEAYSRLQKIAAPTLVIHGETDQLVPVGNAEVIAARINGSQLVKLPHASHIFVTDQPEASLKAIMEFLSRQSA
ncbi:MAG TPA: alpha/beta hydrolase [Blattabacteriaceae bacterium]|jgi:pimeloyl-ACP methyl ester carboxylesterase|nr:alpha/beta hydrolase [Blattabacteriaceae bacterium]